MSDQLKGSPVSNEDIIDDLTKDLKSSLKTDADPAEFVINPGSSAEENLASSGDASTKTDYPTYDFDKDEDYDKGRDSPESQEDPDSDTDTIDEVALKDAEMDLTEEQKEERRAQAEEMKVAGNDAFKIGQYELSILKYTEGLKTCPLQYSQQRSVLYCNRSAAKMKLKKYSNAVKDCTKAVELDDKYLKAYIRRAQSYEETEKYDESLADYKKILELDPSHKDAQKALIRLPPLIEQKNEKLKTEMLGKLKDLGNMILKPFGLSTENFQMEQDPDTKGYKINFKQ